MISNKETLREQSSTVARPIRVLHVLDISLPMLAGYTIRSRGLIHAQKSIGMEPSVVSSPAHQLRARDAQDETIEGIRYKRTPIDRGFFSIPLNRSWPVAKEIAAIKILEARLANELQTGEYDLVHAHSPVLCGLPALRAARKYKLPFVYEIRAFWEDAAVDQNKTSSHSLRYKASRALEQHVVERADAVVGIATSILTDLEQRGVPRNKLFHVPNGVDVEQFKPLERDRQLAAELGVTDVPVLGFIGSLFYFEGVSWLVRAAAKLHQRGIRFKLLIIGHGEDADNVRNAIRDCNAGEYVNFLGKVPFELIQRYYSLVDIMVYPRHSIRLTELVTPLKPLEAMAQMRAVMGSNVGGIREILDNGNAGVLFRPDDIDDFCDHAERLLTDSALRQNLARRGYTFVHEQKNWTNIARKYQDVYSFALNSAAARKSR